MAVIEYAPIVFDYAFDGLDSFVVELVWNSFHFKIVGTWIWPSLERFGKEKLAFQRIIVNSEFEFHNVNYFQFV